MGICNSTDDQPEEKKNESGEFPEDAWKQVHSAVRWNKPIEEIDALLSSHPDAVNCRDPQNGNRPIHIAAQNDHSEILKLIVKKQADLNAKNGKGNTGIHMSIGYNYYESAKMLTDAGADPFILNDAGFPGSRGLDGDKTIGIAALASATTAAQVEAAFVFCDSEIEDLKNVKHHFVQAGLAAKKALGENWSAEMQARFKAIMVQL